MGHEDRVRMFPRVTSAIAYATASQVVRQIMQLLTSVILARLLSPLDFGLMGMALVTIGFAALFKDLGTSAAVVQKKDVSPGLLSTIFWVNLIFGLLTTVLLLAITPLVIRLFGDPRVGPILRLLSLTFLISGIGIVQQSLLERELKFKTLAKIEITATLGGALVGMACAWLGFGVWSLVYQLLAAVAITTGFLWMSTPWRPRLVFIWTEVKSISGYGLNLTGFNIFNYFIRNADNLLIGRFLGAQALGYYNLAYRLLLYPSQSVSSVIGRVMFPLYAQIQNNDPLFRRTYLKVAGAVALITFPLMIGLLVLAEPLVLTVFGSQWAPVILLVQILAPLGLAQSIGATVGGIYQAKGRTDWMLWWGVAAGSVVVVSFVIGLRWGITGVAASYAVASAVLAYPSFAIPFRLISLRVRDLGAVLWRPLLSSGAMVLGLAGLKFILPVGMSPVLYLGALVTWGILAYVVSTWFINRGQLLSLLELVGVGGCRIRS